MAVTGQWSSNRQSASPVAHVTTPLRRVLTGLRWIEFFSSKSKIKCNIFKFDQPKFGQTLKDNGYTSQNFKKHLQSSREIFLIIGNFPNNTDLSLIKREVRTN